MQLNVLWVFMLKVYWVKDIRFLLIRNFIILLLFRTILSGKVNGIEPTWTLAAIFD